MATAFPNLQTPLVDRNGYVNEVWRRMFTSMWQNLGGGSAGQAAPAQGNANQAFNVATATSASNAIPLAQADSRYAAIAGSQTQAFYVGNASAGSNQALRRSQAEGLFIQFSGTPGAIQGITVGASPYAYTATSGGFVAITGGTVSGVTFTRGGTTVPIASGNIPVRNGDVVTVTYSATPTMNFMPS